MLKYHEYPTTATTIGTFLIFVICISTLDACNTIKEHVDDAISKGQAWYRENKIDKSGNIINPCHYAVIRGDLLRLFRLRT